MGILTTLTRTARNVVEASTETSLGLNNTPFMTLINPEKPLEIDKPIQFGILKTPAPKSLDYIQQNSMYFLDLYYKASYYFYNCSILSTVITRITQDAIRNGIDFVPTFQSKCPRCGKEFQNTVKKCKVCGCEAEMRQPDETQKDLFINWEGKSAFDEINRNGWSLSDLTRSFLILSLTYGQPVFLCKSLYLVDDFMSKIDEVPQEFIPISPTKARLLFDETAEPGTNMGFTLDDRASIYDMINSNDPLASGTHDGKRLYSARWAVSEADGGWDLGCNYYSKDEIFHKAYGLPSMTYGTPTSCLIASVIKAWIALELRIEKYYNTGHPQGIFTIMGVTTTQLATIQQSIREQMRDDPYTMPVMGIPPGGTDSIRGAKWFQLADNPTGDMMSVKYELQQRVAGAFGISGLFLGDVNSVKGNSNETQQMNILDRNLSSIRTFTNCFLKWITSKYKGITDWVLKVVEPPDEQSKSRAEDFNKELINGQLAQALGFEIIGLNEDKLEISSTPKAFNPLQALTQGQQDSSLNFEKNDAIGASTGDNGKLDNNFIRDISTREKSDTSVTAEQVGRVLATLMKNGVTLR